MRRFEDAVSRCGRAPRATAVSRSTNCTILRRPRLATMNRPSAPARAKAAYAPPPVFGAACPLAARRPLPSAAGNRSADDISAAAGAEAFLAAEMIGDRADIGLRLGRDLAGRGAVETLPPEQFQRRRERARRGYSARGGAATLGFLGSGDFDHDRTLINRLINDVGQKSAHVEPRRALCAERRRRQTPASGGKSKERLS